MQTSYLTKIAGALVLAITLCAGINSSYAEQKITPAANAPMQPIWEINTKVIDQQAKTNLTPPISQGELLTLTESGDLTAYHPITGKKLWQHAFKKKMQVGPVANQDTILVVTQNGEVRAYDRASYKLRWRVYIPADILATPLLLDTPDNKSAIVKTLNGKIFALDLTDGSQFWFYEQLLPSLTLRRDTTPILFDGKIITTFADGFVVALDSYNGNILWQRPVATLQGLNPVARLIDFPTELLTNELNIFVAVQGKLLALDGGTGKILWEKSIPGISGTALAKDNLYATTSKGILWLLHPNGQVITHVKVPQTKKLNYPAIIDNQLTFIDNQKLLYSTNIQPGALLPGIAQPLHKSLISHPPLIDNNMGYFLTDDGTIIALREGKIS